MSSLAKKVETYHVTLSRAKGLRQWGYPEHIETPLQILRPFSSKNDILGKIGVTGSIIFNGISI